MSHHISSNPPANNFLPIMHTLYSTVHTRTVHTYYRTVSHPSANFFYRIATVVTTGGITIEQAVNWFRKNRTLEKRPDLNCYKNRRLDARALEVLNDWFEANARHPFPKREQMEQLAHDGMLDCAMHCNSRQSPPPTISRSSVQYSQLEPTDRIN